MRLNFPDFFVISYVDPIWFKVKVFVPKVVPMKPCQLNVYNFTHCYLHNLFFRSDNIRMDFLDHAIEKE